MFNHVRKQKQSLRRVDDRTYYGIYNCKTLSAVGIIFIQKKKEGVV